MPKTSIKRKNAQRAGQGIKNGSEQKGTGCKRLGGTKKEDSRIIANSIFALTLKQRPAFAIAAARKEHELYAPDEDYDKMYDQVMATIHNAVFLATGERTTFDPLLSGYDVSEAFTMLFNIFKREVLPKGWEFNVERESSTGDYHIVIYCGCEFQVFWHTFSIEKTVTKLWKKDRRLHDMFLLFMANFIHHAEIPTWWDQALGYVDDYIFEERIANSDFESDEEQIKYECEVEVVKECYKKGDAHKYKILLKNQLIMPVVELRELLNEFSKRNNLVKWMCDTCDFLDMQFKVNDFIYPELVEQVQEGLMFDLQMGVLWDETDLMSDEQQQYLEAESQGCGVHEPVLTVRLTPETKELDLIRLQEGLKWPSYLTIVCKQYSNATKKYER